jgi:diguanylate cyclase (GGDEF)-like protein/PAS domain S-box-containing protein
MNKSLKNVLFIGKDKAEYKDLSGICSFIKQQKINVTFNFSTKDTSALLPESVCDVAVLDFEVNGQDTFEILRKTIQARPHKCIIILADKSNKKYYAEAMQSGAYDFLIKQELDVKALEKSLKYSFSHSKILGELRESESKFKDLVEHLPAMFYISHIHPPYSQIYASPSFKLFGYELEEWLGVKNMWSDVLHPDDKDWVIAETDRAMDLGEETDYEYRIIGKNGQVFWVHDRGHYYYAADGETVYWQGLMNDITERKLVQQQLLHKLEYDDLTGLRNRGSFVEKLENSLARFQKDNSLRFAVFLLDLDRFKTINDNFGHLVGDKFLIEVSRRLQKIVGKSGIVSRLSGDEFAVLIEDANQAGIVENIARQICLDTATLTKLDGCEFNASASIGITISDQSHLTGSDILRNADAAMYHAKQSGRNCFKFYDEELYNQNIRFTGIENELRFALERKEFSLVYQPIVSLETGKVKQIECLIRWNNNRYGEVEPTEFIPIAESNGMMIPIGEWVLEQAFKQLNEWQKSLSGQENLMMSVNISPKQIVNLQFTDKLIALLQKNSLSPQHICLEITENSLIENGEYVLERLNKLNQMGFYVSTDDFGTGYSSLSYLHKFPLNELKIDKSFICNINTDFKMGKIVRTIIALAKSLELKVVAEGVESSEQLENLIDLGCDLAQGYFISKPLPAKSLDGFLNEKSQIHLQSNYLSRSSDSDAESYGFIN